MWSTQSKCEMLNWMKHKLGSRLPGDISITQIHRRHHPYGRKWRGTKEPLDESERGEWKSWLKTQHSRNEDHGIQSHHFMANRWGKKRKRRQTLFSCAPKSLQMVTEAIKRHLLLERKAMTNLDSILKSRDITLLTKVRIVKAMIFPIVKYGCESGLWRKLSAEELMLLNCGVGEDSWESRGQQGDPTSPS